MAAWSDPEIARFTAVPADTSLAYARQWIGGAANREHRRIAVDRVIVVDEIVVGEVGLSSFDERRSAALLGYWVAAEHRGCGIAAMAIIDFCGWAFEEFDLSAVLAEVDPDNPASRTAALNAGFTVLRDGEAPILVLRPSP